MKPNYFLVALVIFCNAAFAQTVPAYVPANSLLGWYPFSGNANNATGTGLNGSVIGPVLANDRFGTPNSAYHFNGNTDHIVIDTTFFNVGWNNYSIALWFNSDSVDNPNNGNNNQEMFNTIPHNGLGLGANWGHCGKYGAYVAQNPGVGLWDILPGAQSKDTVSAHVWNHIALVRNDTFYYLYLNGVLDTSYHNALSATNYFCKLWFGNIDSSRGIEGFWGALDDYGIWNRSLALCEIRRLYLTVAYTYLTSQPASITAVSGGTTHFSVTDTGTGNTYQWQVNSGTGFTNASGTHYSGVTTPTLTVSSITPSMNSYKYRCVVSGALPCVDTSAAATLTVNTLSIKNVNTSEISIAPNPTSGSINVYGAGDVNIKVYNTLGQLVKEAKSAKSVSVAELPVGTYLVKLFDERGLLLYYSKVVKQ